MKFNMNETVKVKLTDKGRAILKQQHDDLFNGINAPKHPCLAKEEDKDGWSSWQLWDLMSRFGPHISLGMGVPFETEIEICKK